MQIRYLKISDTPDEDGDVGLYLDQPNYAFAHIYLDLEELTTLRNHIDKLITQLTETQR